MRWRLLIHDAADGAANMALDEALLESARTPGSPASVRFYRFSSPTLTFGYAQRLSEVVDEAQCRALGIDCVRRITGGRALLHQHETTFAVAAPTGSPPFSGSVRSTYRSIRETIARALSSLGVPVDEPADPMAARPAVELPCLAVPTGHEVAVGGDKIVAASMRWRREAFLVHGSILWAVDRELWDRIRAPGTPGELQATGIHEVAGGEIGESRLIEALTASFEGLLDVPPDRSGLTPEESRRSLELREKYRSRAWTRRLGASVSVG